MKLDVPQRWRDPYVLTTALTLLMLAQSSLGLLFDDHYRDVPWIKATWFGNDWVTLLAAVPLAIGAPRRAASGSARGLSLWLGVLAYAIYNYAYYLFGAALNVFFPLYVAASVLSVTAFVLTLSRIDPASVAASFGPATPVRLIGGYLTVVGIGLAGVWLAFWAAYVFAARPTPIDPEAFKLVAALDISLMATGLVAGGILLWRQTPWGYPVAAFAGVQATLYLLVLSVNSAIIPYRGSTETSSELPLWSTLAACTATATALLLVNATARQPNREH
jgi:hypothetical protein